jgi:hypothetical protein
MIKRIIQNIPILAVATGLLLISAGGVIANGAVHSVHVGGPDICGFFGLGPGCNANFSIQAKEFADGSVKGIYTDRFATGLGFHADIDCLVVEDNIAWVSGIITKPAAFAGVPVATMVEDNGTSKNDPPDRISFSFVGDARGCYERLPYPLFDMPEGQVKVD